MADKKQTEIATRESRDPFALLRQMTSELDRALDTPLFNLRWPALGVPAVAAGTWAPHVDVFERDGYLITKVDLPGVKKDDVSVELSDGNLVLSGERKQETEETKDNVYRSEREYGMFCRTVPLPDGVSFDDVKATFADGVLEVSVPLPLRPTSEGRKVKIQEPATAAKPAA